MMNATMTGADLIALNAGTAIYALGVVPILLFGLIYGFTAPWWKSAIGVMFVSIAGAVVVSGVIVLLSLLLGPNYPGRLVIRIVGYTTFTFAGFMLLGTYLHERGKPASSLPIKKSRTESLMAEAGTKKVVPDIWFPWQRVKRVLVVLLFTVLPALNLFIPAVVSEVHGVVSPDLYVKLNALAASILVVAGAITRILAIPIVNSALRHIGLSSVPRSAIASVTATPEPSPAVVRVDEAGL